ncbi:hypothetical protein [uncultured Sunxiuqinia sp.]|uniref:hypothetical protein n=1 Tax=uncultured Sunxiuqinia sp. TaxID=1573825 RepID=UPI002602EC73|nr:hypothetical protein [uncultured Sunxiuqinia sp.]
MNDLLEKIIRENKDAFEEDAPQGHFERFEQKLDKEFKHRSRFNRKFYLQLAASLLFVLLLGNQVRMHLASNQAEPVTLASVSEEYGEVEYYFTSSINQGLKEWEQLSKDGFISEADQRMMTREMEEFDQMQAQLQKELEANPDDERVINAMLEYYQAKLSVITLIIDKLKEVKQQKLTHNETQI